MTTYHHHHDRPVWARLCWRIPVNCLVTWIWCSYLMAIMTSGSTKPMSISIWGEPIVLVEVLLISISQSRCWMGCVYRVDQAYILVLSSPASEEKFRSIYKIADTVPFEIAVINLVTVAQVALYLFNLLKRDYIDGLICNETSKAFWEFYTRYHPHKSPDVSMSRDMIPHNNPHSHTCLYSTNSKSHGWNLIFWQHWSANWCSAGTSFMLITLR